MSPWITIALVSNLVYLIVFVYLAVRSRPGIAATTLGFMHLLLAAVMSVAPFRSFLDPHYPGFRLGLLHFEHRSATLPTAMLLAWALASALILASRRQGRALWVVAVGDALFALNQLPSLMQPGSNDIQFGEHLTITGLQAILIMAALFVGGPLLSSWWAARRVAS